MAELNTLLNAVLEAPSACPELKAAVQAYIDAKDKKAAADALVSELQEDVMSVDSVIAFFGSEAGKAYFGAETAAALLAGAEAHKAAGGRYCNCPGCTAGAALLENKALLY